MSKSCFIVGDLKSQANPGGKVQPEAPAEAGVSEGAGEELP